MKRILPFSIFILFIVAPQFTFSQDLVQTGVFGSGQGEFIHGYCIDPQGDLLIAGTFANTVDLDLSSGGEAMHTAASKNDIYVAKYDIEGNYLWSFQLGGDPYEYNNVKDITCDLDGNIFITGFSDGWIDFDPSEEKDSIKDGEEAMIFIAKYTPSGEYMWAHGFGNNTGGSAIGWSVAVDSVDGSIVVCGNINDTIDFDPSIETAIRVPERHMDIFLAKYSNDGAYIWAEILTYVDEFGIGSPVRVLIDSEQDIYMGGYYSGFFDMDPSEALQTLVSSGSVETGYRSDAFLSKYNKDGVYQWAFSLGDALDDYVWNFRLLDGKLYALGSFADTVDFDPSAERFDLSAINDYRNGFMAVYETDGTFHSAISLNAEFVDIYGSSAEIYDIDMDIYGDKYLIGSFYGEVDFDPSAEDVIVSSTSGSYDMFLAKYDSDNNYQWAINVGGDNREQGYYTHVTEKGNVIAMGYYDDWCDFDPSEGEKWLKSNGSHDVYLAWYYAFADPTLGIFNDPVDKNKNIKLYPNPAYGSVIIESDDLIDQIEIYTSAGSLVMRQPVGQSKANIDLPEIPQGSYILRVYSNNESCNVRFIKLD